MYRAYIVMDATPIRSLGCATAAYVSFKAADSSSMTMLLHRDVVL